MIDWGATFSKCVAAHRERSGSGPSGQGYLATHVTDKRQEVLRKEGHRGHRGQRALEGLMWAGRASSQRLLELLLGLSMRREMLVQRSSGLTNGQWRMGWLCALVDVGGNSKMLKEGRSR